MHSDKTPASAPRSPARRRVSLGAAALIAGSMMPFAAFAADYPTAKVNTTGLAVTDDVVKVGILHSVTGTMSISETGSVQGLCNLMSGNWDFGDQSSWHSHLI